MRNALLLLLCGLVGFAIAAPEDLEGKAAPDFTVTDIDGKTITLSELKGKVVILDFWTTWCPPCRDEIPHLIALQKKYKNKLQVIGLDLGEDVTEIKSFLEEDELFKKNKINYPIVRIDEELSDKYGTIRAIPTLFVIDKQGKVVKVHVGYAEKELLEAFLK